VSREQIKKERERERAREKYLLIGSWKENVYIFIQAKKEKDTHINEGHDLIEFFLHQLRLPIHSLFFPTL